MLEETRGTTSRTAMNIHTISGRMIAFFAKFLPVTSADTNFREISVDEQLSMRKVATYEHLLMAISKQSNIIAS